MRVRNAPRFLLSVAGYFVFIGIVVGGGILGAQALLRTVPQPEFLQRETAGVKAIRPPHEAVVELKPYRPREVSSRVTWRTSIGRPYIAPVAPTKSSAGREVRKASKAKSTPQSTARKVTGEAADAYAWTPSWRVR
jgi:hypothetical protein